MWKDWILSLSTLRIVHVSEPYNTTDCTRDIINNILNNILVRVSWSTIITYLVVTWAVSATAEFLVLHYADSSKVHNLDWKHLLVRFIYARSKIQPSMPYNLRRYKWHLLCFRSTFINYTLLNRDHVHKLA